MRDTEIWRTNEFAKFRGLHLPFICVFGFRDFTKWQLVKSPNPARHINDSSSSIITLTYPSSFACSLILYPPNCNTWCPMVPGVKCVWNCRVWMEVNGQFLNPYFMCKFCLNQLRNNGVVTVMEIHTSLWEKWRKGEVFVYEKCYSTVV